MKSSLNVALLLCLFMLPGCRLFSALPDAEEAVLKSIFDDGGYVLRAVPDAEKKQHVLFEVCFKSMHSLALVEGSCLAAFLTHKGESIGFNTEHLQQVMSAQERKQVQKITQASSLALIGAADEQGAVQTIVALTTLAATLTSIGHSMLTRRPAGTLIGLLIAGLTATGVTVRDSKAQSKDAESPKPTQLKPSHFYDLPQLAEHWQAMISTQEEDRHRVVFIKYFVHDLGLYLHEKVPEGTSIDRYCYPKQATPHPHNAQCYKIGYADS